jgi:hypothetical protein
LKLSKALKNGLNKFQFETIEGIENGLNKFQFETIKGIENGLNKFQFEIVKGIKNGLNKQISSSKSGRRLRCSCWSGECEGV